MFKIFFFSLGSHGFNSVKPIIACQDIFRETNNEVQKYWGRFVLSWSVQDFPDSSFFLIEVRDMHLDKWFFVGVVSV